MAADPFLRDPGFSDFMSIFSSKYLYVIIGVVGVLGLLNLILFIIALVKIIKSSKTTGKKILWVFVILVFGLVGIIIYFIFGRDKRINKEEIKEEKKEIKFEEKKDEVKIKKGFLFFKKKPKTTFNDLKEIKFEEKKDEVKIKKGFLFFKKKPKTTLNNLDLEDKEAKEEMLKLEEKYDYPSEVYKELIPEKLRKVEKVGHEPLSDIAILERYIRDSLAKGFKEGEIREVLYKAGWYLEEVNRAFNEVKL